MSNERARVPGGPSLQASSRLITLGASDHGGDHIVPSLGERPLKAGANHSCPGTCADSTIHGPAPFHQSPNQSSFWVPGTTFIQIHLLFFFLWGQSSVQLLSRGRPTLCDPMDCSTRGFPVPESLLVSRKTQLPELTQTHVH